MLDVHAPRQTVHTWKDFLVHIAAISIGLLIALGLEATVFIRKFNPLEDHIQNEAENADAQLALRSPDSRSEAAENAINTRLSGNPDLSRLTPVQTDRLEQGFQQAITDDRRLHRTAALALIVGRWLLAPDSRN